MTLIDEPPNFPLLQSGDAHSRVLGYAAIHQWRVAAS